MRVRHLSESDSGPYLTEQQPAFSVVTTQFQKEREKARDLNLNHLNPTIQKQLECSDEVVANPNCRFSVYRLDLD